MCLLFQDDNDQTFRLAQLLRLYKADNLFASRPASAWALTYRILKENTISDRFVGQEGDANWTKIAIYRASELYDNYTFHMVLF